MNPLHPALVHLPIGLIIILPLMTVLSYFLIKKNIMSKKGLILVVALQALLVGSSYLALQTEEQEEDRAEKFVSERVIETHEERAEAFTTVTVITLIISLFAYFYRERFFKPAFAVVLSFQFLVAVLGYRVGQSGGDIVYGGGLSKIKGSASSRIFSSSEEGHDEEEDHDDDD